MTVAPADARAGERARLRSSIESARARAARGLWPYLFLAPFFVVFALFTLWPLVQNVVMSLTWDGMRPAEALGLHNYESLLRDRVFWVAVRNTVLLAAGLVPVVLVLGLGIAVVAVRISRLGRDVLRVSFYLPTVASATVISIVFLWILNPVYGLLNSAIGILGLEPVAWLGDTRTALFSVMLVVLVFSLGAPVILLIAGLNAIPEDLYEAARIDGAGAWSELRWISLPLLRPTMAFVVITSTIASFQVFTVVQLLTQGGPANATQTIVYRVYQNAFVQADFGLAAAASVALMVLGYGIAIVQMRIVNRRVDY